MTKTKHFFFKSSAVNFANDLRKQGQDPAVCPSHYLGPRETFPWFFGWDVVWTEYTNKQ